MWTIRAWAAASNERAVMNARRGTAECSRRRVERDEVTLFLAEHAARAVVTTYTLRRGC